MKGSKEINSIESEELNLKTDDKLITEIGEKKSKEKSNYPVAYKEVEEIEDDHNILNQSEDGYDKPLNPNICVDQVNPIKENNKGELKKGRNLMFEQQQIGIFKLYCHLSGGTEIALMIFGAIGSLGTGIASPLMSYLMGDMINDFSATNESAKNYNIEVLENSIDKTVNKLLYIWSSHVCFKFSFIIHVDICRS